MPKNATSLPRLFPLKNIREGMPASFFLSAKKSETATNPGSEAERSSKLLSSSPSLSLRSLWFFNQLERDRGELWGAGRETAAFSAQILKSADHIRTLSNLSPVCVRVSTQPNKMSLSSVSAHTLTRIQAEEKSAHFSLSPRNMKEAEQSGPLFPLCSNQPTSARVAIATWMCFHEWGNTGWFDEFLLCSFQMIVLWCYLFGVMFQIWSYYMSFSTVWSLWPNPISWWYDTGMTSNFTNMTHVSVPSSLLQLFFFF